MATNKRQANGNVVRSASLAIASAFLPILAIDAQSSYSGCARVSATRVVTQAVAAAVVTGVEYRDMTREGGWHMATEDDRLAVAADPSSHLHALGSYRMARNLTASSCTSDEALQSAAWRGAAMSLAIGVAKEVSDGAYNGFSPTDLAVDAVGAGYAVAQAYVPVLRHVTPTFSVAPSAFLSSSGPMGALTNYAHQTFWLSANVHDIAPKSVGRAWPAALRLSAGRRAYGGGAPSDYVLGLDIDAERLPGSHPVWMRMKRVLHNVRLPGPALVVNASGTRSVGLYW